MRTLPALWIVCASLTQAGCSLATSFDDFRITGDAVSREYAAFRDALAAKLCEREVSCEGKNAVTPSVSACAHVPATARVSVFEHYLASIAPHGDEHFEATGAAACLDAITVGRCEAALLPRECDFLLMGTRDDGSACSVDADCRSGHCVGDLSACGVCSALTNTACADERDCSPGLVCRQNVCSPVVPAGNPCTSDDECGARLGWCDDATGLCATRPSVEGATCGVGHPVDPCIGDLRCVGGTCVRGGGEGAVCNPGTCRTGFTCVASQCREIALLGESCAAGAPCASGVCDDGLCSTVPVETEACDATCAVGSCVEGECRLPSRGEPPSAGTSTAPYVPACDDGYPDASSMLCEALLPAGSPCVDDDACLSGACRGTEGSRVCSDCAD